MVPRFHGSKRFGTWFQCYEFQPLEHMERWNTGTQPLERWNFWNLWNLELLARRLPRPARVDRFCRIRGDLQVRTVVVGVAARLVVDVISHELDHLQRALRAVDVRQLDLRLPWRHRRLRSLRRGFTGLVVMLEQAVGEHGNLRRALDLPPH